VQILLWTDIRSWRKRYVITLGNGRAELNGVSVLDHEVRCNALATNLSECAPEKFQNEGEKNKKGPC
jgi:hypothetical protein